MTIEDFYYRRKIQDFIFQGTSLVRKISNNEVAVFNFEGDYQPRDYRVLEILQYKQFFIVLINWKLDRNLICIGGDNNQVVWRIPPAKKTPSPGRNFWTEILIRNDQPDVVYCFSIQRYTAAFKIETGEMVHEKFHRSPDPRDF